MTGEELFLLAAFSGERSFDAIDTELDRSMAVQVRRMSNNRSAARRIALPATTELATAA
jgi:hypothetical protein